MSTETIDANVARIKSNIAKSYANCERLYATMPSVRNLENLADCIESIKVIGKNAIVMFIDPCVPRVYEAWSAENMAVADALPTPPTYDGMTFEGWGLTLAEVQGITEKTTLLPKYMSADGTRLHITVTAQDEVAITFASGTVGTVDFGEGGVQTITESMAHTYTASGDYVITVRGTGYTITEYNDRLRSAIRRVVVAEECVALPLSDMDLCEFINYAPNGVVVQNNGSLRCLPFVEPKNNNSTVVSLFKGNTYVEYAPMLPQSATNLSEVYSGCVLLERGALTPNVVTMNNTFFNCRHMREFPTLPPTVTSVLNCFYGCTSMVEAPVLPPLVKELNNTFYLCSSLIEPPVIPQGVTNMFQTFMDCYSMRTAPEIPQSVTNMNGCFQNCTRLTAGPVLPTSGNLSINSIFYYCSALTEAPDIPNGVTNMEWAFYACSSLIEPPAIADSVTNMEGAFYACSSLIEPPVIPQGVTTMLQTFRDCKKLRECPVLPNTLKTLYQTFYGCVSIVEPPIIPPNVTDMSQTFSGCTLLRTAPVIPNSVQILYQCFTSCKALTEAPFIPPTVNDIKETFSGTLLSDFYVYHYLPFNMTFNHRATAPLTLHCLTAEPIALTYANPFWNPEYPVQEFIIKVPRSADHSILNAYKTATNWANYADRIFEEDEDFVAPPSPYETE